MFTFFKVFLISVLIALTGCTTLPQLYQSVEDIADNEAIGISISKDALQQDKNVGVTISVRNNTEK